MRQHRKWIFKNIFHETDPERIELGSKVDVRKSCSCWMCCNERKDKRNKKDLLTKQEKIDLDIIKSQLQSFDDIRDEVEGWYSLFSSEEVFSCINNMFVPSPNECYDESLKGIQYESIQ